MTLAPNAYGGSISETLNDLDQTIEAILRRAGRFSPSNVDIDFRLPSRDWSARMSRPTLNCYMFDLHEHHNLREDGWRVEGRGRRDAEKSPPPYFYRISYLITAWVGHDEPTDDEHGMLWHVLRTLVRFPVLNDRNKYIDAKHTQKLESCLHGVLASEELYPWQIHASIGRQEEPPRSPSELWPALDNLLRPSLNYVVLLALDRDRWPAGPPVRSAGIRVQLPEASPGQGFHLTQVFTLPPGTPISGVTVNVEDTHDRNIAITSAITDDAGGFRFASLPPERYTINATIDGTLYRRVVIVRDLSQGRTQSFYQDRLHDQDGVPFANVVVEVEGSGLHTTTDQTGRFALDLPPGRYTLLLRFPGWTERRPITVREPGYSFRVNYGGMRSD